MAFAVAAAGITAGCGNKDNGSSASVTQTTGSSTASGTQTGSSQAGAAAAGEGTESAEFTYPVAEGGTLSYWMELNANVAANYTSLNDTEFGKKLQENTGITIEFQHPAVGQVAEQFNLLLSKSTLPDIIEYSWLTYAGGPQKAIEAVLSFP